MNRYVAAGLMQDLRRGRRVVVVSPSRLEARNAMHECLLRGGDVKIDGVVRANGRERIDGANGGDIRFVVADEFRCRPVRADLIFIDDHATALEVHQLMAAVGHRAPEVVRP